METKQIITATVAVILICLVAIPIIDNGVYEIEKKTQENPRGYYEMIDSSDEVSVSFNNKSNKITVNDQEITADSYGHVVISDQAIIGVIPQGAGYWQFVTTSFASKFNISPESTSTITGTLTTSNGVMTCRITQTESGGSSTVVSESTLEYQYMFIPTSASNNSKNVYCQYGTITSSSPYSNNGTDIFIYKSGGVYSDTYQLTKISTNSSTATINKYSPTSPGGATTVTGPTTVDVNLTWSEIDDTDSYKLTSATIGDGESFSASGLAPKEYYIIEENSTSTIIKLIPVLLIVALVIGIASTMILRRD